MFRSIKSLRIIACCTCSMLMLFFTCLPLHAQVPTPDDVPNADEHQCGFKYNCEDANFVYDISRSCVSFDKKGLCAFVSIFEASTARGIENVAIRAFNNTEIGTQEDEDLGFPNGWEVKQLSGKYYVEGPFKVLLFELLPDGGKYTAGRPVDRASLEDAVGVPFSLTRNPDTDKWQISHRDADNGLAIFDLQVNQQRELDQIDASGRPLGAQATTKLEFSIDQADNKLKWLRSNREEPEVDLEPKEDAEL